MSRLAIHGGKPAITTPQPHFEWPIIGAEEIEAVVAQMKNGELSIYGHSGVVKELETNFRKYHRKDAEKYAKEMWSFTGTHIKYEETDFWGPKGRPTYYSVQEEIEKAIAELMSQKRRELYIRLKDGKSDKPYISRTLTVNYPPSHEDWVNALRQAVAEKYNRPLSEIQEEFRERRAKLEKALEADALEPSPTAKAPQKVRLPKKTTTGGGNKNEWV